MDVFSIVIIVLLVIGALAGFAVGFVKGFTKVKSWGAEYLLTAIISMLIGGIAVNNLSSDKTSQAVCGIIILAVTVALMVTFTKLSGLFRKIFDNASLKRAKKAFEEDGEEHKPKKGIVNRLSGALALTAKNVVIIGAVAAFALTAIGFTHFSFVDGMAIYSSGGWEFFKPYIFDFFIVGLIFLTIKSGYSSGISNALWTIIMIALVVVAGLASYNLAFHVSTFQPAVEGLENVVSGWFDGADIPTDTIAKIILTCGIFLVMLVVLILIGIFVPRVLNNARDGKLFSAIDGVLGAIVATLLVFAVLLFVGGALNSIYDLSFMAELTSYFEKSGIATFFYDRNILVLLDAFPDLPLRDWLT